MKLNLFGNYLFKQPSKVAFLMEREFKMEKWEYKAVTNLKKAGQTIIDNAEKMIGGYKYQTGDIDIHITLSDAQLPTIEVTQRLLPDSSRNF